MRNFVCMCDRCRREVKPDTKVDILASGKKVEKVTRLSLDCATKYRLNLDLCEDCLNAFKDWLELDDSQ